MQRQPPYPTQDISCSSPDGRYSQDISETVALFWLSMSSILSFRQHWPFCRSMAVYNRHFCLSSTVEAWVPVERSYTLLRNRKTRALFNLCEKKCRVSCFATASGFSPLYFNRFVYGPLSTLMTYSPLELPEQMDPLTALVIKIQEDWHQKEEERKQPCGASSACV